MHRVARHARILALSVTLAACGGEAQETVGVDVTDAFLARNVVEGVVDFDVRPRPLDVEGWHGHEPHGRWTAREDAFVPIEIDATGPGLLEVVAATFRPSIGTKSMTLSLNGFVLGAVDVGPEPEVHRVEIPDGVLRPGRNEVGVACDTLHVAGTRRLGVFVDWIRLAPADRADAEYAPGRTAPFLSATEGIEGEPGFAAAGTFEIGWATDDTVGVAGRIVLAGVDEEGRVVRTWAEAAVEGTGGRIRLSTDGVPMVGERTRFLLASDDPEARIRVTDATRWSVPRDDVLFIVIDTLRADALACYGAEDVTTTHLDSLAAVGTLYRNAVAHAPITGPSHAAIFTSQYPSVAGIVNNHEGSLARDLPSMPEIFLHHGYATRGVVSITPITDHNGFDRGFEVWDQEIGLAFLRRGDDAVAAADAIFGTDHPDSARPRFTFVHLAEPHEPYDAYGTVDARARLIVGGETLHEIGLSDYAPAAHEMTLDAGTHEFAVASEVPLRVRRFEIRDPEGTGARFGRPPPAVGPWTTTLTLDAPGTIQLLVAVNDAGLGPREIRRRYRLETEATDRFVGHVLDTLRASGRADRTWVVFTSDHGECLGEHGHIGHVEDLHETSIHVPLIVVPPAGRSGARGVVRDDLAAGIDLLPTLLDLVGIEAPEGLEGVSLRRRTPPERVVLVQTNAPQAAQTQYAHRGRDWKLVWNVDTEGVEYYDLAEDPVERNDRAAALGDALADRRRALEDHVAAVHARRERAEMVMDPATEAALRALGYIE